MKTMKNQGKNHDKTRQTMTAKWTDIVSIFCPIEDLDN